MLTCACGNLDGVHGAVAHCNQRHAGSYPIAPGTGTGETCCTTFWIKFNQRFQAVAPSNETYAAKIETAIYNALLREMEFRTPPPSSGSGGGSGGDAVQQKRSRKGFAPPMKGSTVEERAAAAEALVEADALLESTPTLPPGIQHLS